MPNTGKSKNRQVALNNNEKTANQKLENNLLIIILLYITKIFVFAKQKNTY